MSTLTKREEDIQRLIISGVNYNITLVSFRWKELHQANDQIYLG